MKSAAIIGAGITGLTAAFYLQRRGVPVAVYEASGRAGGAIQTLRRDGYLAEFGPNTILETSPAITALVRDAGLESRRLDPDPRAGARYLVRHGRLIAMPESPLGFLATPLFTPGAKWAVLREAFRPARRGGAEESIAGFVRRRLCPEFLNYAVDALVAGVYAGDPERLSVEQAFPKLAALERDYGSLVKGQIFGARERRRRGETARDRAPKFSFDEGLQLLPDTLRERLGAAVRTGVRVGRMTRHDRGWTLDWQSESASGATRHDLVLYAGTAYQLAEMELRADGALPAAPDDLALFSEVRHPPVASVALGFRREDVAHPCNGYGMLIPRVEGFKILGTIFSSALFPNRAPAGHLMLTSYIGGERHPGLAALPPGELFAATLADLRVLLGARGEPSFRHSVLWPRAIPQYNLGYARFRKRLDELETRAPGLFFAGHYRDGISLGDSIVSGAKAAGRLAEAAGAV